jgi:membrane-associated phospholipid phosphatase
MLLLPACYEHGWLRVAAATGCCLLLLHGWRPCWRRGCCYEYDWRLVLLRAALLLAESRVCCSSQ